MKQCCHAGETLIYPNRWQVSREFCILMLAVLQCEIMSTTRTTGGVLVLHKTIDVLDALRAVPEGLGLAGISAQTGIPKPTAHRILATLESRGYLERVEVNNYRISRKLFEAPRDTSLEQRMLKAARPAMEKLCATCRETLNLGVLDGGEVLVIDTIESPQSVRMTSKIGNRRYPHSTALGKVFLAGLPEREMLRLVRGKGMPRFTQATIVREEDLLVELERVRTQGFALDNTENETDGRCIAAPIFDSQRKVIAALSISGPLPRMTVFRAKSYLKDLAAACKSIASASI